MEVFSPCKEVFPKGYTFFLQQNVLESKNCVPLRVFIKTGTNERMLYSNQRNGLISAGTLLYILAGCLACWGACYVRSMGYPIQEEAGTPLIWQFLSRQFSSVTQAYIIGFVLMSGGAFLVHRANYALMLIREKTFLPILIYVLLVSTNEDFLPLKATSFGVFFTILAIYELFTAYHDAHNRRNIFNAALLISLGSLIWVHILWLIPLLWYGMYLFRVLSFRTFLATLLAPAAIYWIVGVYALGQQDLGLFTQPFESLFTFHPLRITGNTLWDWIAIGYLIGLTLLASIHILTHEYEDNLRTREFLAFLILLSLSSFALYFLYEQSSEEFLQIACFPASILIAHLFTVVRNRWTQGLFHFTNLLFIILFILRIWNFS